MSPIMGPVALRLGAYSVSACRCITPSHRPAGSCQRNLCCGKSFSSIQQNLGLVMMKSPTYDVGNAATGGNASKQHLGKLVEHPVYPQEEP